MLSSENRIGVLREQKNLKQVELAARLKISRGQLANLESGNRKVDLPELRRIASLLGCNTIDLLLPEDAPNHPTEPEAALLAELRAMEDYDPRAILAAAKAVVEAIRTTRDAMTVPKSLSGDPALARALTDRWTDMDDNERGKALQLLDTARDFRR